MIRMSFFESQEEYKCGMHVVHNLLGSDEIPETVFHNTVAILAQETQQPSSVFGDAQGNWTIDVIERVLFDRGYKCTNGHFNKDWILDSPRYLAKNPAFVGFIIHSSSRYHYLCVRYLQSKLFLFDSTRTPKILNEEELFDVFTDNVYAVHRMWMPLVPFYRSGHAFYITNQKDMWKRHECEPSSCWNPTVVDYSGREKAVARQINQWRPPSSIMMSSHSEIVVCSPSSGGWNTNTLFHFECVPQDQIPQHVTEQIMSALLHATEQDAVDSRALWTSMAHCLFGVAQRFNVPVQLSDLTSDEASEMKRYERSLIKVQNTLKRQTRHK